MSILKKLVLALVILVVVLAGVGMLLPRMVHVERQVTIGAPQATVYALIDGFRPFPKWSPWQHKDPNMKVTLEGPEFGVGAKQSWTGDPKTVGTGTQEVVEAKAPELVVWKLVFQGYPPAEARMTLSQAAAGGTQVVWGMDNDMGAGPVGRYFGLMMDKMIGPDFDQGLANLKSVAEGLPKTDFADLAVEKIDAKPVTVAYLPATASKDETEIAKTIGASYMQVGKFMKANGLQIAGAPMTINTKYDDTGYAFDAAIPVDKSPEKEIAADSPVKVKQTYSGKALKVVMKGPYSGMAATYDKLHAYMAARGYESAGSPWDEYVTDPGTTAPADLRTNIVQPVK
ncbi:MAG TPA: SRPBCC family protein [Candidatus Polarisedimenticolaceae bacterium]|nr:SRPBCC family protein [Candidatus Polarisedimenticolaceae bacterium]